MAFASRATSQRGIRDRIAITLWGRAQPTVPAAVPVDLGAPTAASVSAATVLVTATTGLAPTAASVTAATVLVAANARLAPAGSSVSAATATVTATAFLAPTSSSVSAATATILAGAPQLGTPTGASVSATSAPISAPTQIGTPTAAGITAATATITAGGPVRQLGTGLTVTVAWHPRPTGQAHTRTLGAPTVIGRDIQPAGQAHTRAQGNPTLSARALPAGIAHTRGTSSPRINPLTITPAGVAHIGSTPQLVLTPIAADNFNRANSNIAGTNNWLATTDGTMTIASNEAVGALGVPAGNYRTSETYASDQYSQCVVGTVAIPNGQYIGLTVRNTTNQDCYGAFYYQPSGGNYEIDLYKRVAGTWTLLLQAFLPGVLAAGTAITLIVQGNVLSAQAGGATVGAIVDTTIPTGGTPGITSFGTGTLDTWQAGNATTGTVGTPAATDNFNRANAGMSSGQVNWAIMTGYPAVDIPIVTNQLSVASGSHAADVRTDTYNADHWSTIQMGLTDPNATGFVGVLTRINPGLNSGYLGVTFGVTGATCYRIYRLDTGTSVQLASAWAGEIAGLITDPPGTTYTLVSAGNRHSFRVNDAEILAVTDATYTTGKPGIMLYPASTADNWSGGNVPAAATGRGLGNPTIVLNPIIRPAGQAHTRALGNPAAIGRHLTIPAITHARAQGNPTLSARALPAGIVHTRALGAPEINLIVLHPLAISRA